MPAYVRPLFCRGEGPFRWVALSGDPEDIRKTDAKMKELFPDDAHLHRWLDMAGERIAFQGLPARICWIGLGERHRAGLAFNEMVQVGRAEGADRDRPRPPRQRLRGQPQPRDRGMQDGSDAVSDWPLLNALLNTAGGATWVSLHHGGGVGMGYSQHSGVVIVCDGTDAAAKRIERVLWNDPATGVMRHADAGYDERGGLRAGAGPEPADGGALMLLRPGAADARRTAGHPRRRPAAADGPAGAAGHPGQRGRGAARGRGRCAVYGVNTGFGKLASTRISEADLATLQLQPDPQPQRRRRRAAGAGRCVRLMLATKAASLARGHSGVRPVVIDTLLAVHNAGLVPCVPSQGSVGASGDLAPLSHMTLALMGEGEFLVDGQRRPAAEVLRATASRRWCCRPRKAWR